MRNKFILLSVLLLTLFPLTCLAQSGIYASGYYSDYAIEGQSLSGDYASITLYAPFGVPSIEASSTFHSTLTGQAIQPFDDSNAQIALFDIGIQQSGGKKLPGGTDTAELVSVGDGMFIIFLFLMFLIGVRMGKKDTKPE